jgi:hypothetical protein
MINNEWLNEYSDNQMTSIERRRFLRDSSYRWYCYKYDGVAMLRNAMVEFQFELICDPVASHLPSNVTTLNLRFEISKAGNTSRN